MAGINNERAMRSLDALEETLNSIFLYTGAVFENPEEGNAQTIASNNSRMKDMIPRLLRRWEDNIMELDAQISQAQQILRRDLVLCRTKPNENAQAASAAPPGEATKDLAKVEPPTQPSAVDAQPGAKQVEDVPASENKAEARPEQPTLDTNIAPAQDGENLDSAAIDLLFDIDASPDKASPNQQPSPATKGNKDAPDAANDKPQSSQAQDQANATTAASDSNNMDANGGNTDIASLLPGLGDFANDEAFQGTDSFSEMVNPESFMAEGGNDFDQLNQDGFNFENSGNEFNLDDLLTLNDGDGQLSNDEFGKDFFNLG